MGVYLTAKQMVYSAHNYKARVCVCCHILDSRFPASLYIFLQAVYFSIQNTNTGGEAVWNSFLLLSEIQSIVLQAIFLIF